MGTDDGSSGQWNSRRNQIRCTQANLSCEWIYLEQLNKTIVILFSTMTAFPFGVRCLVKSTWVRSARSSIHGLDDYEEKPFNIEIKDIRENLRLGLFQLLGDEM